MANRVFKWLAHDLSFCVDCMLMLRHSDLTVWVKISSIVSLNDLLSMNSFKSLVVSMPCTISSYRCFGHLIVIQATTPTTIRNKPAMIHIE